MANKESNITVAQVLFPLSLLAFVIVLFMGLQTSLIMRDRSAMHDAVEQQTKQVEDANKLQTQFSNLAFGVRKLSQGGDKDATALLDRMKKAGIVFQEDQQPQPQAAGTLPTSAATATIPNKQ
jgi:hypothetical protein